MKTSHGFKIAGSKSMTLDIEPLSELVFDLFRNMMDDLGSMDDVPEALSSALNAGHVHVQTNGSTVGRMIEDLCDVNYDPRSSEGLNAYLTEARLIRLGNYIFSAELDESVIDALKDLLNNDIQVCEGQYTDLVPRLISWFAKYPVELSAFIKVPEKWMAEERTRNGFKKAETAKARSAQLEKAKTLLEGCGYTVTKKGA